MCSVTVWGRGLEPVLALLQGERCVNALEDFFRRMFKYWRSKRIELMCGWTAAAYSSGFLISGLLEIWHTRWPPSVRPYTTDARLRRRLPNRPRHCPSASVLQQPDARTARGTHRESHQQVTTAWVTSLWPQSQSTAADVWPENAHRFLNFWRVGFSLETKTQLSICDDLTWSFLTVIRNDVQKFVWLW